MPSFTGGELRIGIELGFLRGHLKQLTLFDDDPSHGEDWNDWLEEKKRPRAERIRSWLRSQGSQVGSYYWGGMWASYDAGSRFTSGGVRFAI